MNSCQDKIKGLDWPRWPVAIERCFTGLKCVRSISIIKWESFFIMISNWIITSFLLTFSQLTPINIDSWDSKSHFISMTMVSTNPTITAVLITHKLSRTHWEEVDVDSSFSPWHLNKLSKSFSHCGLYVCKWVYTHTHMRAYILIPSTIGFMW